MGSARNRARQQRQGLRGLRCWQLLPACRRSAKGGLQRDRTRVQCSCAPSGTSHQGAGQVHRHFPPHARVTAAVHKAWVGRFHELLVEGEMCA